MIFTQLQALKADILARSELAEFVRDGRDNAIAAFYNEPAVPQVMAWREAFESDELFNATKLTDYIARTAGERQAFDLLLSRGSIKPTRKTIRDAVADIFSGSQNSSSRGAILNAMTEAATRAQVLFGGSQVTTDTVTALKRDFVDLVTDADVAQALRG